MWCGVLIDLLSVYIVPFYYFKKLSGPGTISRISMRLAFLVSMAILAVKIFLQ